MTYPHAFAREPGNTRLFMPQGNGLNAWQTWAKPLGCTMVHFLAAGAGGGGGAGFSAAAAARGGGGSGGCSGLGRLIVPAWLLPDVLYLQPGIGLVGNGGDTFLSVTPSNVAANVLLRVNGGGVGGAGTGAAVGAAGSAGAAPTPASAVYSCLGEFVAIAGLVGVAGGAIAGAAGTGVTWGGSGLILCPGASGAGTTAADFAGGAVTGAGLVPNIPGGLAGTFDGAPGFVSPLRPPSYSGGGGGGSSNTGNGGKGGDGGPGCGGGGGGGGVTGGLGGRGGDGFVYVTAI